MKRILQYTALAVALIPVSLGVTWLLMPPHTTGYYIHELEDAAVPSYCVYREVRWGRDSRVLCDGDLNVTIAVYSHLANPHPLAEPPVPPSLAQPNPPQMPPIVVLPKGEDQ